jgi:hypothetical protein
MKSAIMHAGHGGAGEQAAERLDAEVADDDRRDDGDEAGRDHLAQRGRVEMSTQRALSGLAVPSMRPGISRNWRRTSSTMPPAARPTAVMVSAPTKRGSRRR